MSGRGRTFHDLDTIRQIVEAARAIESFCHNLTLDEFRDDVKTWSATQYQILVIGEAVGRLSESFVAAHSEIPWRDINDMRHVLAHAYDLVRLDIVWQTATHDVPSLRAALEPLLQPPAQAPE